MKVLVVGATGATGKLVVRQLLEQNDTVRAIVRSKDRMLNDSHQADELQITEASLLDMDQQDLIEQVQNSDTIISCLGHTLTFKGIYGQPRLLVTEATQRICAAIQKTNPDKPIKFILMNTSGNSNKDLDEPISFIHKLMLGLIRILVPPHVDNEKAAEFLRSNIGQGQKNLEWVVVRPDTLIDEEQVTDYNLFPSPIRSALFNPGKTSRINVAHFMVELTHNRELWNTWKGKMPLIYNTSSL